MGWTSESNSAWIHVMFGFLIRALLIRLGSLLSWPVFVSTTVTLHFGQCFLYSASAPASAQIFVAGVSVAFT